MVATRSARQDLASPFALLDSLLAGNTGKSKVLLDRDASLARQFGPSGFSCLHAAALTDGWRLIPALLAAGLSQDQQIAALDGPAAFELRQFLTSHSKLPSSKLCAVFRGAPSAAGRGYPWVAAAAAVRCGALCWCGVWHVGTREAHRRARTGLPSLSPSLPFVPPS